MPEDNTNTPALVLMPAAPKRKATKSDLVQMIAELEYERRQKEAEDLLAKQNEAFNQLIEEAKKELAKRLATASPADFEYSTGSYYDDVFFKMIVKDTPKMRVLRERWKKINVRPVYKGDVLKEVRSKMEQHRTDHIKLALAEDPALRQGVEELRKQLFAE